MTAIGLPFSEKRGNIAVMGKLEVSVVIPAFNEEGGIADVVAGLKTALAGTEFEILVVDDGSTDDTARKAEAAGARVLRHPANRGYGRSLLTGFEASRYPWVLMSDADGTYPPEEAGKVLAHAPAFDMIVGAREGAIYWGTPLNYFLRWVYLRMASFVAGERIPDANSGFRLIRKEAFDHSMPILCYGYSLSTTMTLSFLQDGRFVKFVPIAFRERAGHSKVRRLRDIPRTLQVMTQVILYYNPLKFAFMLALFPAFLAAIFLLRFFFGGGFGDLVLCIGCALGFLGVFLCGCILDALRNSRLVMK
jgi:glycosyltransferase involved in cell wall biosynthesis